MTQDDERIERHLVAQRERGAHYPGPIPPPNRLSAYMKIQDLVPRERATSANGDTDRKPQASAAKGRPRSTSDPTA